MYSLISNCATSVLFQPSESGLCHVIAFPIDVDEGILKYSMSYIGNVTMIMSENTVLTPTSFSPPDHGKCKQYFENLTKQPQLGLMNTRIINR